MEIVIVEEDPALGFFLRRGLESEGHATSLVAVAEDALRKMRTSSPDLLLINAVSALRNGSGVLTEMRRMQPDVAILALLDQDSVAQRVRCLDLGADDCMTKPLSFEELAARCRALLRRRSRAGEITLRHGALQLERVSRRVYFAGREVNLTTKEFGLLELLMERKGGCCGRAELQQRVFQIAPDAVTNVVDVYVNYLRKKLRAVGEDQPIATVRNVGYRLDETPRAGVLRLPQGSGPLAAHA